MDQNVAPPFPQIVSLEEQKLLKGDVQVAHYANNTKPFRTIKRAHLFQTPRKHRTQVALNSEEAKSISPIGAFDDVRALTRQKDTNRKEGSKAVNPLYERERL